jgi:hypothetical protein
VDATASDDFAASSPCPFEDGGVAAQTPTHVPNPSLDEIDTPFVTAHRRTRPHGDGREHRDDTAWPALVRMRVAIRGVARMMHPI